MPRGPQVGDRPGRRLLDRIGDAQQARRAGRRSATKTTVWPSRRRASARSSSGPGSTPSSRSIATLPIATERPSTRPSTPRPVRDWNDSAAGIASPRSRRRARATAAARGCSLDRSSPADNRSNSDSSCPEAATIETTCGLPFGQRSGLVEDEGIDPLEDLERLGVAHQHARAGPPPGAHHDRHRRGQAQGTRAGDDQHGHRVDEPRAPAEAAGPIAAHTAKATSATRITAGTK